MLFTFFSLSSKKARTLERLAFVCILLLDMLGSLSFEIPSLVFHYQ